MSFHLPADRPALMGILNVTPDSFSDGGLYADTLQAVERARTMMAEGADLIDVGGESTRPGSEPVSVAEELRRVMPVVELLCAEGVPVSIDTSKPEVARQAVASGVAVVNDVTGFRDKAMIEACLDSNCALCIMHMKGTPRTMQHQAVYDDVVKEVLEELSDQIESCEELGIAASRIWIDPGIGFGKTTSHNLELLKNLERFVQTDYPVLVGVSRKAFIGRLLGSEDWPLPVDDRLEGTLAAQVVAQMKGAKIIRAHDVRQAQRAISMTSAILDA